MIGSGSLRTNRNRPVSTSTLTRIFVPKPKKAFQSPGVHQGSFAWPGPVVETLVMMQTPLLERSEEHTSELQSLMRISYAVFCLKKKKRPHMEYTRVNMIQHN